MGTSFWQFLLYLLHLLMACIWDTDLEQLFSQIASWPGNDRVCDDSVLTARGRTQASNVDYWRAYAYIHSDMACMDALCKNANACTTS